MIIVISNWKKKLWKTLVVITLIAVFALAVPVLTGKICQQIPALSGWFQEEHPSGNPMRVENEKERGEKQNHGASKFEQAVDQFVLKIQDFYYEE